jgi:putative ABC transport system permease protein
VRDVQPEVFVAYRQQPYRTRGTMTIVVRAERAGLEDALVPALRERIRGLDRDVPVSFSTLDAMVDASVADRRFTMTLLAAFAGVALLLAAVGIYGVLSSSVAQRTHEIGIRLALGAEPRSVVGLLLRGGLGAVAAGLLAGLAGTLAATRALQTFLFGVAPLDPAALGAAVVVLALVASVAGYVPARRAARVDPLVALRLGGVRS